MTPFEAEFIARTAFAEASSEGRDGLRAVIHVIFNLAKLHDWTPLEVCLHGATFSCWNALLTINGKTVANPDRIRVARAADDDAALLLARQLVADPGIDLTFSATHYFVSTMAPPAWAASMIKTAMIGKHVFYRANPTLNA